MTVIDLHNRLALQLPTPTKVQLLIVGTILWMLIVRTYRWRMYNAIHEKYGKKWNEGKGTLTPDEAQEIVNLSSMWDMPLLMNRALSFSLFKTFAIPSIAKLLLKTAETSTSKTVTKRYADTEIMITTWVGCPISGFLEPNVGEMNRQCPNPRPAEDPRAMISLARVNWLHSHYRISNDDYLYTLSLFTLEPTYWTERYGWRVLSPLEKAAYFIFWKDIGEKMNMQDIPETMEDMITWSKEYEESRMLPDEDSMIISENTVDELLYSIPKLLKPVAKRVAIAVMEDRVRIAMRLPEQPWIVKFLTQNALLSVMMFQRFFLLPRRKHGLLVHTDMPKFKLGEPFRLIPRIWRSKPWYSPAPKNMFERVVNRFLHSVGWFSEIPGAPHLRCHGYRLEEMGPVKWENEGHKEVLEAAARLQGCPIVGPLGMEGRKSQ